VKARPFLIREVIAQYVLAATSTLSDAGIASSSRERRRVAVGLAGVEVDMVTLGSEAAAGCCVDGEIRGAVVASSRMGCIVAMGLRGAGCGAATMAVVAGSSA